MLCVSLLSILLNIAIINSPWAGKSVRGNHGGHNGMKYVLLNVYDISLCIMQCLGGKNYQLTKDDFFLLFDYKQEMKDSENEYVFIDKFVFGVDALLKAKIEGNINAVTSEIGKGKDKKRKKKKTKAKVNNKLGNNMNNSALGALFADKSKKVGVGRVHAKRVRKIIVSLISFRNVALIKQSKPYFEKLDGLYSKMAETFDLSKLKVQIGADLKVSGILLDDKTLNALKSKLNL